MTRRQKEVVSLVLTFLIGALTNVATGSLPDEWKPYLWLSWVPLVVCFLVVLVLQFVPERTAAAQPNNGRAGQVISNTITTGGGNYVDTGAGDYAEGDIDKRQGLVFVEGSTILGDIIGQQIVQSPQLSAQDRRNRSRMLQKVRDFWVKGVLEKSVYNEVLIELGLETHPDAVAHPWDMVIRQSDREARPLQPGTKIGDVFDQMGGELLILGAPGSGKTTILLELARDLITHAEQDENLLMPIVFNLSSWAQKCAPLVEWLIDELNTRYDVPRKLGQAWIEANQVLLLLDGLDEVRQDQRAMCVDVINAFRQEYGLVSIVVCSRVADYEALTSRLKLQGAVIVKPLTPQQIGAYLESIGDQLARLRAELMEDAVLRELAESPLMLNVMSVVYQGAPTDALAMKGTLEERRRRLFLVYVEQMFARRGIRAFYTQHRTISWLCWLAQAMSTHAQTIFFLEHLQPNYLTTRSQRLQYAVGEGLAWGVFAGLVAVIANGLVVFLGALTEWVGFRETPWLGPYLRNGLLGGLIGGLAGGLIGGVIARLTFDETELTAPTDTRRMPSVRNGLRVGVTVGLAVGMARGLAVELTVGPPWGLVRGLGWGISYGLAVGLGYGIVAKPGRIEVVETLRWSWSKARTQIIRSLRYGIFLGLTVGLAVGIVNGIAWDLATGLADGLVLWLAVGVDASVILLLIWGVSVGEIETKTVPNQGIWRSARNALRFGMAIWLVVSFIMVAILSPFPSWGLSYALSFGIGGGFVLILVGGLLYGGIACVQHIVLRVILWRSGHISWQYTRFLDYCAERIFLRKVGGGYIFVHRLLMEYFTSLDA
ncbi:MAG: NACHT domain-containing protein [Roseiflexaceae bacterium]